MSDPDLHDPAVTERACTCTPPPSYEGPCAWCDVHGLPSVAFEQGLQEGEHGADVVHRMEIRELAADRDRWQHLAEGWHCAHNAAMGDRDAARAERDEARARLAEVEAENTELRGLLQEAQHVPHESCCPLGRDGDPDIRRYHSCDTRDSAIAPDTLAVEPIDSVLTAPEPGENFDKEFDRRDPACVAAWPECYTCGYDPRCCRFPKSCSCDV